jgi:hypothetical protein
MIESQRVNAVSIHVSRFGELHQEENQSKGLAQLHKNRAALRRAIGSIAPVLLSMDRKRHSVLVYEFRPNPNRRGTSMAIRPYPTCQAPAERDSLRAPNN